MNFIKTLAAAAVLAAVSAPAMASIKVVADGTSEIFLAVGDNNGSFILDTGVNLNDFLSNAAGASGTIFSRTVAGAAWTSYIGSDSNLFDGSPSSTTGTRWALFVYDGTGNFDVTQVRALSTVGAGGSAASFGFSNDEFVTAFASTGSIAANANGTGTHTGTPAVNGSSFNAKGTAGYAGATFFSFGGTNTRIGNAVGVSSGLVLVSGSNADDGLEPVNAAYLSGITASFNGTTLTVVAAPIPEPETYALMLGGLAAVAFIARRPPPVLRAAPEREFATARGGFCSIPAPKPHVLARAQGFDSPSIPRQDTS